MTKLPKAVPCYPLLPRGGALRTHDPVQVFVSARLFGKMGAFTNALCKTHCAHRKRVLAQANLSHNHGHLHTDYEVIKVHSLFEAVKQYK